MWAPILLSAAIIVSILMLIIGLSYKPKELQPYIQLTPIYVINVNIEVGFTTYERMRIMEAIHMWQKATHGLVIFHLISMHANSLIYDDHDNNAGYSINFVKTESSHEQVQEWDRKHGRTVLGYAAVHPKTSIAFMVTDRMSPDDLFRTVAAHEIGHLLGLKHNPKKGTIMFEFTNHMADYVTASDVKELIYSWRNRL